MANKNTNTLYRVYDKRGKYHHSYTRYNKESLSWAVDCAASIKGKVYEVSLDDSGTSKNSKLVFSSEGKINKD